MKLLSSALTALVLCVLTLSPVFAQEQLTTGAKQAIIVDYETGSVLFEKNADERMPTSSMSKVMTMYVLFDALKNGKINLDDELLVSEKAWKKGGSKMFVEVGKTVRVEDLIRGIVIQSGNDATIVIAEGLAGSEDAFAGALNRKAKELGMNNSHFMNASGWPDPDHYSTARDLARLAEATIKEFPDYYTYYGEESFTYHGIKQENRNPLIYKNIGADGLKTGHTEDGGYGLIGTGVKDGRRVVMVLNGMESMKERSSESARLLQWALNGFTNITLFNNDDDLEKAPVYLGVKSEVGVKVNEPIQITIPKLFESDLKIEVEYKSPLKAPIAKGAEIGVVKVFIPKGDVITVPLVTSEDIAELGFMMKIIAKARLLSTGQGYLGQ